MNTFTLLLERLLSIAFWLCILGLLWLVLQVIGFTSFRIPTDSMLPTLQPGDCILVNKGSWADASSISSLRQREMREEVKKLWEENNGC